MITLGAHIKTQPTYPEMVEYASSIGADTFAFFLRPPRGGKLRALKNEEISSMACMLQDRNFGPLVAHAPYVYNLASKDPSIREKTCINLAEDAERIEKLDNVLYNLHPGAHGGQGRDTGISFIQEGLARALEQAPKAHILLETMAGKGTEIGGSFEDLADILEGLDSRWHVDVCLDTCHIFDGGYDIQNELDQVLSDFDRIIGLKHLKAIHLNGSKFGLGSKKDRHAALGFGCLGLEAIAALITHPKLQRLPFILETPNDIFSHKDQIKLARHLIENHLSGPDYANLEAELEARYPTLVL